MSIYGSAVMSQGHMSYATASLDFSAAAVILVSILGYLPPIAAVLAIIWYVLQIWESRTIQTYISKRHERTIIRLTAKLAALNLRSDAQAAGVELKAAAKAAATNLVAATAPAKLPGEK